MSAPTRLSPAASQGHVLITGGAGFIGTNLADRLLSQGQTVMIYDNLTRRGVEQNLRWLRERHNSLLLMEVADIRDRFALREALTGVRLVYHLAAQVAVTSSLTDPANDFEINARGTLNLLEEIRLLPEPPMLVFSSTNKVYGSLPDVQVDRRGNRVIPVDPAIRALGIGESRPLSFHSPYGCSKGAADQYVLDYARTFGLPATVFRLSCVYGPHQHGNEDQGWLAHFLIRALAGEPITIFGDGLQVRDALFVGDLVEALLIAERDMARLAGRAFNLGGGPANTVSLLELTDLIANVAGARPRLRFEPPRGADQRYFVADTRTFSGLTGWRQSTGIREGMLRLYEWLRAARTGRAGGPARLAS